MRTNKLFFFLFSIEDSDKEESNHEDIIENHDEANETNDNEFEVPEIAVSPPSPRPGRKEIATSGDPLLTRTPEFELELGEKAIFSLNTHLS